MKTTFCAMLATAVLLTASPAVNASPKLLVKNLEGAAGSTIGPRGDLFVTEGAAGRVSRVDPKTGKVRRFVTGLPKSIIGIGGATDVKFIDNKAYVLVTLVGPDVGGSSIDGIYRIDGRDSYTVIADIGAWARANPPDTRFDLENGLQWAMEVYRGGFLVTDGHHNRVLWVTLDGEISDFASFLNIVPTGLAVRGKTVLMAQAGPSPHLPEDGKIVAFGPLAFGICSSPIEIASGAPLLVDVEYGRGHRIYGLAQGIWDGAFPGSPALPKTGQLVQVRKNGKFKVIVDELDTPTSMQFIGDTAYVVTLNGEIWKIRNVSKLR